MNANLVSAARTVIPDTQILVNVIRLRVKQLSFGHRPLVLTLPGLGFANIALTEIIEGKLTFQSAAALDTPAAVDAKVVEFPGVPLRKKQAA